MEPDRLTALRARMTPFAMEVFQRAMKHPLFPEVLDALENHCPGDTTIDGPDVIAAINYMLANRKARRRDDTF
jgi:hypothetical protein